MAVPFLLEIGTEEIPDWMIAAGAQEPATNSSRAAARTNKLGGSRHVHGRDAAPPGPSAPKGCPNPERSRRTVDRSGRKRAREGRSPASPKSGHVAADQLEGRAHRKGEYCSFLKQSPRPRRAATSWPKRSREIIGKIYFPKTMYWTGKGGPRFIRPIRWIVALLDDQVIPFEIAGVKSGSDHPRPSPARRAAIPVTFETYEEQLREQIRDPFRRRAPRRASQRALDARSTSRDDALARHPRLPHRMAHTIRGSFDPAVPRTPARSPDHGHAPSPEIFLGRGPDGKLAPEFVAVMNTAATPKAWSASATSAYSAPASTTPASSGMSISRRNSPIALPIWPTSPSRPSSARISKRPSAWWHLAEEIAAWRRALPMQRARRTARKADLTTEMVKEFTELQGIVGGLYAAHRASPKKWRRRSTISTSRSSMDDSIPPRSPARWSRWPTSCDTLRGCFGVGLIPTGSKDPFALRRAAQGIVKILVEGEAPLPLVDSRRRQAARRIPARSRHVLLPGIRGFKYDEVNAVLASGYDELVDVEDRLDAIARPAHRELRTPRGQLQAHPEHPAPGAMSNGVGVRSIPRFSNPAPKPNSTTSSCAARNRRRAAQSTRLPRAPSKPSPRYARRSITSSTKFWSTPRIEKSARTGSPYSSSLLTEFSTIADFSEIVTQH